MKNKLLKLINRLENAKIKPLTWLSVFFSVAFLRNFLEGILERTHTVGTHTSIMTSAKQMFMLFNLEWITLILAVILILHIATMEKISRIFNISIFFMPLILIVPVIDFIVYFPTGSEIQYIMTASGYVRALKYFFVPGTEIGVSAGVRLEVFAAVTMVFIFVLLKNVGIIRASVASFTVYFFAVSSMCFPVFFLLPAALFYPVDMDSIVNSFTGDCPKSCALLDRISLMISIILLLFSVSSYYFSDSSRMAIYFKKIYVHAGTAVFTVLFAAGFVIAVTIPASMNDCPVFLKPFGWFYLVCGVLFASLLAGSLRIMEEDKLRLNTAAAFAALIFPHLFSLNMHYTVFICGLAVTALSLAAFTGPFKPVFSGGAISAFVRALTDTLVFFSGYTAIAGINAPQTVPVTVLFSIFSMSATVRLIMTAAVKK